MKPLAFTRIILTGFKNYAGREFSLGPGFNLVTGLNGIGKTNLLDAIYYLSVGKSYFTPYDGRVVLQGQDFFRLEAALLRDTANHSVVIKSKPGVLKEVIVDGMAKEKISHHLGFIPMVFSAPRDIELVTGSGQMRRRYFDHLLCQTDPEYLKSLMQYTYLLQLRNAALKNQIADIKRVVETYDEQMAPLATVIFEKRKQLIGRLTPSLCEHYKLLSDDREPVAITYESQLHELDYTILADKSWEADKGQMRSNTGIHKDDFGLMVKDMSAKEYGSQGQIKSLIFSMHLAKYQYLREETGFQPILVLDDIFDKLDERRFSRLLAILSSDDFGQIFISDTSSDRLLSNLADSRVNHLMLS